MVASTESTGTTGLDSSSAGTPLREIRIGAPQRRHQIAEEAADLVVALIERQPADRRVALAQHRDPLPEQRALAEARRRGQHGEARRQRAVQRLDQALPLHQPGAQHRRPQLGLYEHVTHPTRLALLRPVGDTRVG